MEIPGRKNTLSSRYFHLSLHHNLHKTFNKTRLPLLEARFPVLQKHYAIMSRLVSFLNVLANIISKV